MELRPRPLRPWGQKIAKGYVRLSNRRWIRDTGNISVPDEFAHYTSQEHKDARAESKSARRAAKASPQRPAPLDSGFYEPEIATLRRRSNDKPYLQRQPAMDSPSNSLVQNQSSCIGPDSVRGSEIVSDSEKEWFRQF